MVGNIQPDNEETVQLLKDVADKNGHVGSKFIPFEVDVSVSTQVDTLFDSLDTSFGEDLPLSVVVNSAGIGSNQTLFIDTNYQKVFDINLKVSSTRNCSRFVCIFTLFLDLQGMVSYVCMPGITIIKFFCDWTV